MMQRCLGFSPRLLILLMLSATVSCVTTRSQLRMGSSDARLAKVPASGSSAQAYDVLKGQEYDEQFRTLNGRIEEVEERLRQGKIQESEADQMRRREVDELRVRLKAMEEALLKLDEGQLAIRQELQELRLARKEEASARAAAKKEDKVDPFQAAEAAFKRKEWRQAILDYQRYREKNPTGKNYPEATLKIGMAFQELKMRDEARAFYEEVVAKFPKSPTAKTAAAQLKALK